MAIQLVQHPTAIAETTTIEDKLSEKMTVFEEIQLGLFTGFKDTTFRGQKESDRFSRYSAGFFL